MLPYNGYAHESEPGSTAPASSSKKAVTPVHKYHYQARFSNPLKRLLGDLGKQGDFRDCHSSNRAANEDLTALY